MTRAAYWVLFGSREVQLESVMHTKADNHADKLLPASLIGQ